MSSNIIHDATFRHGSKYGYILGCHSSACPAPMKCIDVHTRYAGDWAFRKAIDAGETSADIAAREQKAAQEALEAAKKARRARPGTRTGPSAGDRRAEANKARAGARNTAGFERNPDKNRKPVPTTAPIATGASS